MLVVSRKKGESIEFPTLGVVVRVIGLKKSRIELGIEAPRDVKIARGEIVESKESAIKEVASRDGSLPQTSAPQTSLSFAQIEARIAALAEMSQLKHRVVARQLAADATEQLHELKRSSPDSTGQLTDPQRMGEFVAVRTEVLEELRRQHGHPSLVRQSNVGYAVSKQPAKPIRYGVSA